MLIAISSVEADRLAEHFYVEPSKPLSYLQSRDQPNALGWWLRSPKNEAPGTRHRAAVVIYMQLMQGASPPLGPMRFPAVFKFTDGKRRRPDKGVIKTLATNGLITDRMYGNELVFELTPQGWDWLNLHT